MTSHYKDQREHPVNRSSRPRMFSNHEQFILWFDAYLESLPPCPECGMGLGGHFGLCPSLSTGPSEVG